MRPDRCPEVARTDTDTYLRSFPSSKSRYHTMYRNPKRLRPLSPTYKTQPNDKSAHTSSLSAKKNATSILPFSGESEP